jgi:hypothetical protein
MTPQWKAARHPQPSKAILKDILVAEYYAGFMINPTDSAHLRITDPRLEAT